MLIPTDVLPVSDANPELYLTSTGAPVLHPPLPSTMTAAVSVTESSPSQSVPLLLNPDIIQSTNIPILSPQVGQAHFTIIK